MRVTEKNARAAPADLSTAYPIAVGTTMLITAMSGQSREIRSIARSAMRSGAYLAVSVPAVREEPSDVRVDEAPGEAARAGAVLPGRVRVAVDVRELVALAVVRHRVDDATFDCQAAGKASTACMVRSGGEGRVREQPAGPDGDAVHSDHVDHGAAWRGRARSPSR